MDAYDRLGEQGTHTPAWRHNDVAAPRNDSDGQQRSNLPAGGPSTTAARLAADAAAAAPIKDFSLVRESACRTLDDVGRRGVDFFDQGLDLNAGHRRNVELHLRGIRDKFRISHRPVE